MQTKILKSKKINDGILELVEIVDDFGKIIKYEIDVACMQKGVVGDGAGKFKKITEFNNKDEAINFFRFGFKKFKEIKGVQLNFKIFLIDDVPIGLQLTLSFSEEIFKDGCFKAGKYHKDFSIYDYKWEEISGDKDYLKIKNEFQDAEEEFKTVNNYSKYKNRVNLYLIDNAEKFLKELT